MSHDRVVYISAEGHIWTRPVAEFMDKFKPFREICDA